MTRLDPIKRVRTPREWQPWCTERQLPWYEAGWSHPDISADHVHLVDMPYRTDSGATVSMARVLFSRVAPDPETLLLIEDGAVWPSSQHTRPSGAR